MKDFLFSGIRPTNTPTLGNYFGAMANWVKLQDDYNCLFCVVDYHAVTTPFEPKELEKHILEATANILAVGIDPRKSILFRQSDVSEHTELAWILNCLTPLGELKRMTQFKEKSLKHPESIMAGLLNYPILMAADILLYQAKYVPVGQDQVQHVEFARTLARLFNKKFGETFVEPQAVLNEAKKIMSLTDPTKKMSKSDDDDSSIILDDTEEIITRKINLAMTDPNRKRRSDKGNPNKCNIYDLHKLVSTREELEWANQGCRTAGIGCVDCKKVLIKNLINLLKPIQEKRKKLLSEKGTVESILKDGAERARKIAQKKLMEVKEKIGILRY